MKGNDLTEEELKVLIDKVTEMAEMNVLKRQDMVKILKVCDEACGRRIAEIDKVLNTSDIVQ